MQLVFGPRPAFLSTFLTDDFGNEARIVPELDGVEIDYTQIEVTEDTFFAAVHFSMEGLW
jgi:hypothetical protein